MKKTVLLIGTLDTKGVEVTYVKELIEKSGCQVLVVDNGIRGVPIFQPDVTRQEVANAAGTTIGALLEMKEPQIIELMSKGLAKVADSLYHSGKVDGIFSLGGSMGTSLSTAAMRSLPFGIPKIMVSTVVSTSDMRYIVGAKDIIMFHSVCDILGLNIMTKRVLSNAANAMIGMVNTDSEREPSRRPIIALSNLGSTTQAASQIKALLEERGYEVIVFHSQGMGGQALEEVVREGMVDGVFDLSINEVMAHHYGGIHDAGPSRLEAAANKGIPQLIAPGNIDFLAFWPEKIPQRFKDSKMSSHSPPRIIARTSKEDEAEVGRIVARKLNNAKGNRAVIIPKQGFSDYGRVGNIFHDPEADSGFGEGLHQYLNPEITVVEVDAHINDPLFCREAVKLLTRLMKP